MALSPGAAAVAGGGSVGSRDEAGTFDMYHRQVTAIHVREQLGVPGRR
jgi:hypothetical protein